MFCKFCCTVSAGYCPAQSNWLEGLRLCDFLLAWLYDVFGDIIAADEGTVANKYGFVRSDNGIMYVKGQILLGEEVDFSCIITRT